MADKEPLMSILLAKRRRGIFLSLISGREYKGQRAERREERRKGNEGKRDHKRKK